MTLVVWDGKSVAADSLASMDGMRAVKPVQKLFRSENRVYALLGTLALRTPMIAWVEKGCQADDLPKAAQHHEETRLLVFENGRCLSYKLALPYPDEFFAPHAWGYLSEYALGCVDSGNDAERAVEMAIARDTALGAPVQVIDLESLKAEKPGSITVIHAPDDLGAVAAAIKGRSA